MAQATESAIDTAELQRRVKAVEPGASVVPQRIIRRVILQRHDFVGFALHLPHRKCYAIPGPDALGIMERDEIGLGESDPVPETVLLLAQLEPDQQARIATPKLLVMYWRLLFHAKIHDVLERKELSAESVGDRIRVLGRVEFEEALAVLRGEDMLLPPRDDRTGYIEFAATYQEMRCFHPDLLPIYFPGVEDHEAVQKLLDADIDAMALRESTRLEGAPDPAELPDEIDDDDDPELDSDPPKAAKDQGRVARLSSAWAQRRDQKRLRKASRVQIEGNVVKSMIARCRMALWDDSRAVLPISDDIEALVDRLSAALEFDEEDAQAWREALPPLVRPACRRFVPNEARLLLDLQKACVDFERPLYQIRLMPWLWTFGRRPLKRLLPHQFAVLAVKHLKSAARRARGAAISEADRLRLLPLIYHQLHRAERRLQDRLRPIFRQALLDNGIEPTNLPERVALHKIIEELTEEVVERGFLTFGDLRDAVSRNNLKLPDVAGPRPIIGRDRLLNVDRALAESLPGIYREAEIYLRLLHRFSALAYGNIFGRFLTRFIGIPLGASYLLLAGLDHTILAWISPLFRSAKPEEKNGDAEAGAGAEAGAEGAAEAHDDAVGHHAHGIEITNQYTVIGFALFLFGLIHFPAFRRSCGKAFRAMFRGLRWLVYDLAAGILANPWVRAALRHPTVIYAWRFIIKPSALTALFWPSLPKPRDPTWLAAVLGGIFVVLSIFLNSRRGRETQEILADLFARAWTHIKNGVIQVVVFAIIDWFRAALEFVERILYAVDQWLRFRMGQGRLTLAFKAVFGAIWAMVRYLIRVVIGLFVEPQVNPIKHFPVVTVSHKLITVPGVYYLAPILQSWGGYGKEEAVSLAIGICALIPGVFGFLVWELKENWKLYEGNRARTLKKATIGHHGETMIRFLKPGFHSGTLPKIFAKLRSAARKTRKTGRRGLMIKHREALRHARESLRHFIESEFLKPLHECRLPTIRIEELRVGCNRVAFELMAEGVDGPPARIEYREHEGWLAGGLVEPGWLASLDGEQLRLFAVALAGLHKLAGVDLTLEDIQSRFGPGPIDYAIHEGELQVWPQDSRLRVEPHLRDSRLLFSNVEIAWTDWVRTWESAAAGQAIDRPAVASRVLPAPVLDAMDNGKGKDNGKPKDAPQDEVMSSTAS